MTRRNIELLLLGIANVVFLLMYGSYLLNCPDAINLQNIIIPFAFIISTILAHVAVRKLAPNSDPAILPIVMCLTGIGITFITRLAPDLALRQVMWLFAGIICMIVILVLVKPLSKIANYKYTFMVVGFLLLIAPMLPILGQEIYGSRIWIHLGPFSFQPGELAKIAIALFLAGYLAHNREMLSVFTHRVGVFQLPDLRTLMPLLIMWVISMLIVIFEKDLGSALVFFFVFITMLYVASGRKFYLVVSFILAAIAGLFLFSVFGHVQDRVNIWLDPFQDPTGSGFQIVQSLYSLADGGLFGSGIGKGLATQIPVVESDFIFIAIAEELGLLGGAAVLLLFLCFAIRGFLTASRAKNDVSSFLTVGLTTTILLQAFIIVAGVTKLIPLTGLTLPFISQGGSSLLASFVIVGFLLRCGEEGTGHENDLKASEILLSNGVLGRVSLGKRLTGTLIVFSILFAILVANLTYIMVVQADEIKHMSGNNHVLLKEQYNKRGDIETKDGVVLAKSEKQEDGTYERRYPAGSLACHVVGYASTRFGTSGIEGSQNDSLKGEKNFATWQDVLNNMMGKTSEGNDVTLTINSDVQKAAEEALQGRKGACVVIDSGTGAVMASASSPSYKNSDVDDILSGKNNNDDSSAMYNRATQALYAPGSTFKIVSLSTALAENVAKEDDVFNSPGVLDIGGGKVTNFNNYAYGSITLARATEVSSNTVYAQVGERLGQERLVRGAEKFMFNKKIDFDIETATSLMPDPDEMTLWETAWAAAGEPVGEHPSPAGPQSTTLQMALVGCAIANNGVIYAPYLVDSIKNPSGEQSYNAHSHPLTTVFGKDIARRTAAILANVVRRGTGTPAAIDGVTVAGKTGTAEKGGGRDDSWFVGFADSDEGGSAVIAIVLEDSNDAPAKSQNVLKVALEKQGKLTNK
ncbi:MAG: FtsW/RodA/SpoVE family cell cycle protein [Coriobacteriia bacterium]|nr:FtsW/RodA/SpoVE family cell cycle protein [Coriobacteriia bacterium]